MRNRWTLLVDKVSEKAKCGEKEGEESSRRSHTKQAAVRASSELSRTSELPRHQLPPSLPPSRPLLNPIFCTSSCQLALEPLCLSGLL
jgi:hypothetical protein